MTKRILKWEVPIDDEEHNIGNGKVVHVGLPKIPALGSLRREVCIWTEETMSNDSASILTDRTVKIFGTGREFPDDHCHVGSVVDSSDTAYAVWHVYEVEKVDHVTRISDGIPLCEAKGLRPDFVVGNYSNNRLCEKCMHILKGEELT